MYIVYRTENTINGKFYYGVHNGSNKSYLGSGKALQSAIAKYGKENFIRRTIMELNSQDEAYELEELIVDDLLLADPNCYNLIKGGRGGHVEGYTQTPWNKGIPRTEETKRKLSEANKGKTPWMKGKTHSESAKNRMSEANKGNKHWVGKTHSEESKAKMSKARLGRVISDEWKDNISKATKGKKKSEETKTRMSKAAKKRPLLTCPHCNKKGKGAMHRWHFDNCKYKN